MSVAIQKVQVEVAPSNSRSADEQAARSIRLTRDSLVTYLQSWIHTQNCSKQIVFVSWVRTMARDQSHCGQNDSCFDHNDSLHCHCVYVEYHMALIQRLCLS